MAEPQTRKERRDFLTERAIRFFDCCGDELESTSQLLKIRLDQLASAYTVEAELPREAVDVDSRVKSLQFRIKPRSLEDYIREPKRTGYRSIHLLADISYDRVKTYKKQRTVVEDRMICEIQIRTKLQDAWAEFTHKVHCNIPSELQADYETAIAEIARRLAAEDRSALAVRDILQRIAETKELGELGNDQQRI